MPAVCIRLAWLFHHYVLLTFRHCHSPHCPSPHCPSPQCPFPHVPTLHLPPAPPQADKQLRQWVADLASISSARAEPVAGAGPPPPGRELYEGLSPLEVRKLKVRMLLCAGGGVSQYA